MKVEVRIIKKLGGLIVFILLIISVFLFFFIRSKKDISSIEEQTETELIILEDKIEETEEIKEPETEEEYVSPIDFDALREQNEDIIAWVRVPNTNIDYPILWNNDNEFYLKHDLDKKESVYGSIFLDKDSEPDFSGRHNIIYGHNMKNKSMFQNIILFKDEEFFKNNRDVYVYTKDREYHLRTMACLYTDASYEKRQTAFESSDKFKEYVDKMTHSCEFREIPEGMEVEKLWSFITCSYEFNDARTILYCYEVE